MFAGYDSQQPRFAARGFPFAPLPRSQAALEAVAAAGGYTPLLDGVLVCRPQLEEVPAAFAAAVRPPGSRRPRRARRHRAAHATATASLPRWGAPKSASARGTSSKR